MMSRVVYKYHLEMPMSAVHHELPKEARVVHVGIQEHEDYPVQMWVELDPEETKLERRAFALVPTGVPYAGGRHLGTVIHQPTLTVWHLIEYVWDCAQCGREYHGVPMAGDEVGQLYCPECV